MYKIHQYFLQAITNNIIQLKYNASRISYPFYEYPREGST